MANVLVSVKHYLQGPSKRPCDVLASFRPFLPFYIINSLARLKISGWFFWTFGEKGPPGSHHGWIDLKTADKLESKAWFEVNPTFGSREIFVLYPWAYLPPICRGSNSSIMMGALAHCLQLRDNCNMQNGRRGSTKYPTGSYPWLLGSLNNFAK